MHRLVAMCVAIGLNCIAEDNQNYVSVSLQEGKSLHNFYDEQLCLHGCGRVKLRSNKIWY